MAGLQKILIILLVLVLVLLALVFSLNNQMAVSLNFLLFETQPHGVAVWIIMAFVVGALVGVLMTMLATVRNSVSRRTLQKRLDRAEQAHVALLRHALLRPDNVNEPAQSVGGPRGGGCCAVDASDLVAEEEERRVGGFVVRHRNWRR